MGLFKDKSLDGKIASKGKILLPAKKALPKDLDEKLGMNSLNDKNKHFNFEQKRVVKK